MKFKNCNCGLDSWIVKERREHRTYTGQVWADVKTWTVELCRTFCCGKLPENSLSYCVCTWSCARLRSGLLARVCSDHPFLPTQRRIHGKQAFGPDTGGVSAHSEPTVHRLCGGGFGSDVAPTALEPEDKGHVLRGLTATAEGPMSFSIFGFFPDLYS